MAQIATRRLAQLCRRAGTALQAGLPTRQVWQKEAERGSYTQQFYLGEVNRRVSQGETLADSLRACHGYFPPLVCEMVDIGERTGRLDDVLLRLAENYEHLIRLQRTFLFGIAWPIIELTLAVLIVGLLIFVLGMVGDGQTDVIGLGVTGTPALAVYFALVAVAAVAIAVPTVAVLRGWLGPAPMWLAIQIPLLGGCLRTMALSRFAWSLAMAHEAGMDARAAVRLALSSTQNSYYTSHEDDVDRSLLAGREIHEALRDTRAFSAEFLDLLENGEETGQISEQMVRLSNDYRERAQGSSGLIAVLAGVAVFGLVAIVIIAMIFRLFFLLYLGPINEALQPM